MDLRTGYIVEGSQFDVRPGVLGERWNRD